ncbi:universal stress protein A-like protein isoform X2 [Durio zibethinus]|uniref:Universal stress protein A-like protein isoform X2 n=1 Tax=Durio zibethinus TaxID=66656 RepID=A0A6P6AY53_DURZI|nr:universal stress protein A-like protein isoform X2 [Durio zibethinus]
MEAVNLNKKECKFVVAVDESEESMYALSWCLGNLISQNTTNNLVLLYVKPPPPVYSSFHAAGYVFSSDVIRALEKYGSDLVKSVMGRAEAICGKFSSNIHVERIVGSGDAKDVICHIVDKIKADTLVMGSHGYGFFKRALLGSVSDHCAKHVKCPVVIVKHPEKR